jgi:hypothetical protein
VLRYGRPVAMIRPVPASLDRYHLEASEEPPVDGTRQRHSSTMSTCSPEQGPLLRVTGEMEEA